LAIYEKYHVDKMIKMHKNLFAKIYST